jgi:hypothetical protein
MAKRLQRLCHTPPKRLAAMRAFARRYGENVRFQFLSLLRVRSAVRLVRLLLLRLY